MEPLLVPRRRVTHYPHSQAAYPPPRGDRHCPVRGDRLRADPLYRQPGALWRQLHHRRKHYRDVDARPQARRAVVALGSGQRGVVRPLRVEGVIPHRDSLRDLFSDLGVRLLQMAADNAEHK